jgi:four helix bundle protein
MYNERHLNIFIIQINLYSLRKMFVFEEEIQYGNPVAEKSLKFAIRIVKFYKIFNKKDYSINPVLKQLLKSGTSIGANISEAQSAFTKKDFINKLGIALKEARETILLAEIIQRNRFN